MLLRELVATSEKVASTRSRLAKRHALASLLASTPTDEIAIAVAFLTGAPRQGRIGIGWATIRDADAPPAASPTLDLRAVDEVFATIADTSGSGSAETRLDALRALMLRATAAEQDFLERLLLGELRQGALESVLMDAVAVATAIKPQRVRRAAMLHGDLATVAATLLTDGEAALEHFAIGLFRPIQPMLAQPADDVEDALDRLGTAQVERKLDGARVQIHRDGDKVRVYSRSLRDVTVAVPEVVAAVAKLPAERIVLDGEAIAMRADGRPHPFQVTMRRFGRKLDVDTLAKQLPLTLMLFDLLHLDGEDWIDRPLAERSTRLIALAPDLVVEHEVTDDAVRAQTFFKNVIEKGHEGIMVKDLNAEYEAGSRGSAWLKVKPTHTLDLVVLAAEWGSGRRQGWLSNLHLGARDEDGGFVMLGKTFKGLTDEMLEEQTARLLEREIKRFRHVVHVRPELVVEIAFNDVQTSSRYPAGMALRFARVRRYRDDKRPEDADTIATVRTIYEKSVANEDSTHSNIWPDPGLTDQA
ncbi:MAG: ATP-dependent DNA ligase [Acidobacteriota bacterium]